jgi:membrane-bound metal-dependent hydrolase YbcI (DUF457 family)
MCTGPTHGISGITTGLALGDVMGASPGVCALLAGVSFFGAYVPDIDHRQSTVTHLVPVLGPAVSFVMRKASRRVYAATKGPRDEPWTGEHRHLTHTAVFAAAFGGLVGCGAFLAASRVGVADPLHLAWLVGVAMALGCVTHCLGDSLTLMGLPVAVAAADRRGDVVRDPIAPRAAVPHRRPGGALHRAARADRRRIPADPRRVADGAAAGDPRKPRRCHHAAITKRTPVRTRRTG